MSCAKKTHAENLANLRAFSVLQLRKLNWVPQNLLNFPMAFPCFRRSHFRSQTHHTLFHILSQLSSASTTPTKPFNNVPDNGNGRMGQENQEREPECAEFVGSDFMDPKDPVPQNEMQEAHGTTEGVGDKGKDFSANKTVLDHIEGLMGIEETYTQANGLNEEQRLMDELELVVKGTEDPVCDDGLIPLNSGLGEKQNNGNEVEVMDYQVEHVEFMHSDANTSGNASKLQEPGELNQLASEGLQPSLMFNVSTPTEEQASALVIRASSSKHESQQKETELVKSVFAAVGSLPTTEEGELEKEEQYGQKVAEAMHISLDLDMDSEALNKSEEGGLLDSTNMKDKSETWNEREKLEKLISMNNATNSSNILIEDEDLEEGEIPGDFGMDGNILIQNQVLHTDVLEETMTKDQENSSPLKQMVYARRKRKQCPGSEEKKDGKKMVDAGTKKKCGHGSDEKKEETKMVDASKKKKCGRGSKKKKDKTMQMVDASTEKKHGPGSEVKNDETKMVDDASKKKKRGPGSEEKKDRRKINYRKNRAEKNREEGIKRLKLPPIQKPKIVPYCRHYLEGKCYEGDKCKFSHDTVPLTKSTPCNFFARGTCLKGDGCPFDHQLSKYPCYNFVSSGSCGRGDACMFSHQVPTNQVIPMPSTVSKPELKSPLLSGNTNFSMPLNNHGCSSVQQNHSTNSKGIHSHINTQHKMTDTSQKQPTPTPKGVRFMNVAKLSPSPSTLKQGMVTPNKEILVQNGTRANQSASGTIQNMVEIAKKSPAVTPKGINFLTFGKGAVCSFRSPVSSNRENSIKLSPLINFVLPQKTSSSLNKDDSSKVSDRTKQNVPLTDPFSNEILDKNQYVAEGMKSKSPGKASTDDSMRNHSNCKSVQEGKKANDNSQTSSQTSAMLPVHPFVSHQSSERPVSGYHKHASNSGQRALLSTLAFAAELESDIKMKCPAGASPLCLEENK